MHDKDEVYDIELHDRFWEMVGEARADLTDAIYWEMVANPQGKVPYLVS